MDDEMDKMADIAAKREEVNQLYAKLGYSLNMEALLKEHGLNPLEWPVRVAPCNVGHVRRWVKRCQDGSRKQCSSIRRGQGPVGAEPAVLSIKCNGVEIVLKEPIPEGEWELRYGPIRVKR